MGHLRQLQRTPYTFTIHQHLDHSLRHKKFPHEQCGSQHEPTHESAGAPSHQDRPNRYPIARAQRHATTNAIQAIVHADWLLDHGWSRAQILLLHKGRQRLQVLQSLQKCFCGQEPAKPRRGHGDNGSQLLHQSQPINQLDFTEDAEIWASWSRMTARMSTETASAFRKWEQATGITYSSHAILADPSLQEHFQPTSVLFHDWMHALLCNGVMSIAIYNVLQEVNLWNSLVGWLACWNLPGQWKTFNVVSLFQCKRLEKHLKAQKFSSTASELLTALLLVDHYFTKLDLKSDSVKCFQAIKQLGPSRLPTKTSNIVWKTYWLSGKNVVGTW